MNSLHYAKNQPRPAENRTGLKDECIVRYRYYTETTLIVVPPVLMLDGAHGFDMAVKEQEVGHAGMMVAHHRIALVEGTGHAGAKRSVGTAATAAVAVVIQIDELRRFHDLRGFAHISHAIAMAVSPAKIIPIGDGTVIARAKPSIIASIVAGDA